MSAPKAENGFVGRRIVSPPYVRRNNSNKKASNFNDRKITRADKSTKPQLGTYFVLPRIGVWPPLARLRGLAGF
jgi:hypothetical protein